MKAEYNFSEATQGAIITPPANKTKICLYLDNASLRCLQEQGDLAEIGYELLLNRALKQALPDIFIPEGMVQVTDLERFTFRLKNLIAKGEFCLDDLKTCDTIPDSTLEKDREKKEQEQEDNKRRHFYRTMAWLTAVNNLLGIFFQNQDIGYVQSIQQLTEKMTVGTSVNKVTQVICILKELSFDIDHKIFNLDSLHS